MSGGQTLLIIIVMKVQSSCNKVTCCLPQDETKHKTNNTMYTYVHEFSRQTFSVFSQKSKGEPRTNLEYWTKIYFQNSLFNSFPRIKN